MNNPQNEIVNDDRKNFKLMRVEHGKVLEPWDLIICIM